MELAHSLKPALVALSGGLGDIGSAMVKTLTAAGADVAVCDRHSQDEGSQILKTLVSEKGGGFYCPLDVSDSVATDTWFEQVEAHYGRPPNIIVSNAAVVTLKHLLELTAEEWTREIQINLSGAYFFARTGAAGLRRLQRHGRIIMVGSWAAHAPHPALPAYSVAKAGLRMLTQSLALELAPDGILVNELAPGFVNAGLSGKIYQKNPTLKARDSAGVPLGKLLGAEDVAGQLLYLCSDFASHMTGSTLLADGGLSLLQGPQRTHE